MADLFGIMNILDPGTYDDEDDFFERFGREMPTADQIIALQVGSPEPTAMPVLLTLVMADQEWAV